MQLDPVEARVLGTLVEKEMTTPDHYPLTLNALVNACNQTSNRDPVVSFDEATVEGAIDSLREKSLVRWVKEVRSRSPKYRHDVAATLRLDAGPRSLLAVLLLRGPQTVGELRTRTERYHDFEDLERVEATLRDLSGRETPLVRRMERRPGQKEDRWQELLGDGSAALTAGPVLSAGSSPKAVTHEPSRTSADGPNLDALVRDLQQRVERLERELGLD